MDTPVTLGLDRVSCFRNSKGEKEWDYRLCSEQLKNKHLCALYQHLVIGTFGKSINITIRERDLPILGFIAKQHGVTVGIMEENGFRTIRINGD